MSAFQRQGSCREGCFFLVVEEPKQIVGVDAIVYGWWLL
jgi:hypothetical protein